MPCIASAFCLEQCVSTCDKINIYIWAIHVDIEQIIFGLKIAVEVTGVTSVDQLESLRKDAVTKLY